MSTKASKLHWCYYVAYSHSRGFGATSTSLDGPITTFEQVQEMGFAIAREVGWLRPDEVVVVSYTLLRTEVA